MTSKDARTPRGPNTPTTLAGRLLGVLRGDKYMMNAYPPRWRDPAGTSSPEAEIAVSEPPTGADALER